MPWLAGWDKRIKITIDHNQIDAQLSHFPVTLFLKSANGETDKIFDEVGANKLKIAITKTDGETELYAEIVKWDSGGKIGILHISRSGWNIPSDADYDIYIYYDNDHADNTTYIGDDPDDTPTHAVWNSNFKLVAHMEDNPDTSHIKDSTANNNDGTKAAANSPISEAGKIGNAQHFNGSSSNIVLAENGSLDITGTITLEAWVNFDSVASVLMPIIKKRSGSVCNYGLRKGLDGQTWSAGADELDFTKYGTAWCLWGTDSANFAALTWYHVAATYNNTTHIIYKNGVAIASSFVYGTCPQNLTVNDTPVQLGSLSTESNWFDGLIDEVRISNVVRAAAWIKATHATLNDSLLTYGNEETSAESIKIEKTLKYCVIKTPSAITKSLKYTCLKATAPTKSLKYCVKTTPTKETKSLKYDIFLGSTKIEKTLKYCVISTPSAITKSLQYACYEMTAIQKTLKYCVIATPTKETKSLEYCVLTDTKIQKSLQYEIPDTFDKRGFVYGISSQSNPGDVAPGSSGYDTYVEDTGNFVAGAFEKTLINLVKGETYYVRAYAHNSEGYAYGNEVSFTAKTDVKLTKSLKYCVIKTPSAITKSLQYEVKVAETHKIEKSLGYKVKGSIKIQKGLIYKILAATGIQKALKYTIETTPSAKTKSLQYNIFLGATTIQKSLGYAVLKATDITKGLIYRIITDTKIQKSLTYAALPSFSIQKTLKYCVEITPAAKTKELRYCIFLGSTKIEKSLTYKVKPSTDITKGLVYKIISEITIQKSLKYVVETTPTAITKSLQYSIFLGSTKIEKGLTYDILTETKIQKSLQYAVVPAIAIQKSLKYTATTSIKITKSLKYTITGESIKIEKPLKYVVEITPTAITKALGYNIYLGATTIQKSLQYAVRGAIAITKGLIYKVLPSIAINKTLKYCVPSTPAAKQKELRYAILTIPTALTKGLEYCVLSIPSAITKSLAYKILTQTKIEKELKYGIILEKGITKSLKYVILTIPSAITKGLEYRILTETKIEKSLHYEVLSEQAITKSLKYCMIATPAAITKSLKYQITITPSAIEKSLHYEVLAEIAITKSLKYCIINQPSAIITKGLIYSIGGRYPYDPAVSPYEKVEIPYDPKTTPPYEPASSPYESESSPFVPFLR